MPTGSIISQKASATTESKKYKFQPTEACGLTIGILHGKVYNDTNDNGVQDITEGTLAVISVKVISERGAIYETTTNANGFWEVTNLLAGVYKIEFTLGSGYVPSVITYGKITEVSVTACGITTFDYFVYGANIIPKSRPKIKLIPTPALSAAPTLGP
jgi:hypothetical protein